MKDMKKEYSSSASWNSAASAGLIMGLGTIALALVQSFAGKIPGLAGSLIGFLAMVLKIAACIYLFKWLLVRFYEAYELPGQRELSKFGLKVALLSALVVSAYSLVEMLMIKPDAFAEAMEQAMANYSAVLDSNSMRAMETMMGKMPVITFFTSIVYCFIWGWVLTGIYAKSIIPEDPFGDVFKGGNDSEGKDDSNQTES